MRLRGARSLLAQWVPNSILTQPVRAADRQSPIVGRGVDRTDMEVDMRVSPERIETTYAGNVVEVSASWLGSRYEVVVHFNPDGGSRNIGHKTMYMSPSQWEAWRGGIARAIEVKAGR